MSRLIVFPSNLFMSIQVQRIKRIYFVEYSQNNRFKDCLNALYCLNLVEFVLTGY